MKVLVVGSGGREHALAWAIARSPGLEALFVAPGNGGTASIAHNVDIAADDIERLLQFVESKNVDLTVVGPEAPLVDGIADRFARAGRRLFGPSQAAARLEGSKVFSKEFMQRNNIPTAEFAVFDDAAEAHAHIDAGAVPVVVKADGLAAGKGVFVAKSRDEARAAVDAIMVERQFGESGSRIIVEACLVGEEVSVHAICGDSDAMLFPFSQDHKRIHDGDMGPNTGGMGAYSPVPFMSEAQRDDIMETVILRTLHGMAAEGHPFRGVLYAGLMMTEDGPRVLEYNVRFGDPETQVLLPMLKSDLLTILHDAAGGALPADIELHAGCHVATVVMAAAGYPGDYEKGQPITGIDDAAADDRVVFHAGTERHGEGYTTCGGRVLAVSAWQATLADAVASAYTGVELIRFDGAQWRRDIARRALD